MSPNEADSDKRQHDKRITKPHAVGRQPIQVRRLDPREATLVALLALHDAQRVPTLIVGVQKHKARPLGGRGEQAGDKQGSPTYHYGATAQGTP